MMIDNDYSKNKTLLPDFGLGVIQKASYLSLIHICVEELVFGSKREGYANNSVTDLPLGEKPYMRLLNVCLLYTSTSVSTPP